MRVNTFVVNDLEMQVRALLNEFPELLGDEDLKADMLSGGTDFYEIIEKIHLSFIENSALLHGLIDLLDGLKKRREALGNRVDFQRTLIKKLMDTAEIKSIDLAAAKLTVGKSPSKVIITDEAAIPDAFVRIKREPNKSAIKEALIRGENVPGATLSNGGTSLTIR